MIVPGVFNLPAQSDGTLQGAVLDSAIFHTVLRMDFDACGLIMQAGKESKHLPESMMHISNGITDSGSPILHRSHIVISVIVINTTVLPTLKVSITSGNHQFDSLLINGDK